MSTVASRVSRVHIWFSGGKNHPHLGNGYFPFASKYNDLVGLTPLPSFCAFGIINLFKAPCILLILGCNCLRRLCLAQKQSPHLTGLAESLETAQFSSSPLFIFILISFNSGSYFFYECSCGIPFICSYIQRELVLFLKHFSPLKSWIRLSKCPTYINKLF